MAKRPRDPNQLAKYIVDLSVGNVKEPAERPETSRTRSGRAGGLKGGKTRMAGLSAEQRRELAKKAAAKRWKKPAPE